MTERDYRLDPISIRDVTPTVEQHPYGAKLVALRAELQRLQERVRELEGALKPFAAIDIETYRDEANCHVVLGVSQCGKGFTVGDLRRARPLSTERT